jgi:hypothetical protein
MLNNAANCGTFAADGLASNRKWSDTATHDEPNHNLSVGHDRSAVFNRLA